MAKIRPKKPKSRVSGKLRIGDDWNAITIIALSQSNPLKAVAEFVENSIDAGAENITITRGREKGLHYLVVVDDGAGVPKNDRGVPDFKHVATHICDSIKRRLKADGATGIQGGMCANLSWKLKRLQTPWFDGIGRNNIKPVRERSRDEESVTFGKETQEVACAG